MKPYIDTVIMLIIYNQNPFHFQAVITASLPLSCKTRHAVTLVIRHGAVPTIKAAVSPLVIPANGHRQPGRPYKTIHTLYNYTPTAINLFYTYLFFIH